MNDPQRQAEHNEINSAPSRTEVQSDLNNAKALNEAMHQLENEVHLEIALNNQVTILMKTQPLKMLIMMLYKSEEYH